MKSVLASATPLVVQTVPESSGSRSITGCDQDDSADVMHNSDSAWISLSIACVTDSFL